MSRTRRNQLHWKKRPENLNPEPINWKTDIRNLGFEKRHELGMVIHDICAAVKSGFLDARENAVGQKGKKWAKKFVAKALRRFGLQQIKEQLKEND